MAIFTLNGALQTIDNPTTDPNPNTTQPPEDRVVRLTPSMSGEQYTVWLGAIGGSPTVELWAAPFGTEPKQWLLVNIATVTAFALTAGEMGVFPQGGAVPAGMPLFLRVTAVGGATRIAFGVTRG